MPTPITIGGSTSTGNDSVFGDLIEKVYRRITGPVRELTVVIDQSGGIGSDDTTVVVNGPQASGIAPGMRFSIEQEDVYVTDWDSGINTATIIRGYNGSDPAAHANGTLVYVNPRFSRYDIGVAINDDLRDLSGQGLFRVGTTQITYNPVFQGYDLGALPTNFLDVLEVRYKIAPPYRTYPLIPRNKWRITRTVQNSDFPSGLALIIYAAAWPGLPIYLTYSAPYVKLVDESDSLYNTPATNDEAPPLLGYSTDTISNLTPTMIDIPPLGAAVSLVLPLEIARNRMEDQPDPRKAAEVVAGAIAASVAGLDNKRNARIKVEAGQLALRYRQARW